MRRSSSCRPSTETPRVAGGGRDGDRLLGEHVERHARHHRRFDQPLAHAARHDGALQQIGAELGEDPPPRHLADAVTGATDALQPAGHRLGRLDLHDEVDRPHVDAELERRGGDQAGQPARLELALDDEALLTRQRAVMGTGDLAHGLAARGSITRRQVVQAQRDALGRAPVVDEHQRGVVFVDELQQLRVDRRPDRAAGRLAARDGVELERRVGLDHRLDRHVDQQVERLARAGIDDRALARRADEKVSDLGKRALRRRETDALHVAARLLGEPLERDGKVRAPLRLGHCMDLVDDHPAHAGEQLLRPAGQHDEERLGRRDQDVGRRAQHLTAFPLRRVARAHRHLDVGADAAQRGAQVALDVVAERLERRDVDQAQHALGGRGRRGLDHEAVERPQKGGEGLARAGGRRDERVPPAGDRRPGQHLGRGRLVESSAEPRPHLGSEARQSGVTGGVAHLVCLGAHRPTKPTQPVGRVQG